ncbi:tetratricopeptide repeat protein [Flavobacterium reichenbachii]|uniref:Tetratricopeptide repeat protein n=1 Tax=Flavobacterium reichenbachii TaxID=362418 RepID=A0A085ZQC5_9FLAO|nr:tetratricopeptide repeat protein [Flavobacterium reichenbachii]KFF06639.1 hypothetical protein IW19_14480 [Flavobacterium reichenbachii]OXB18758.1 hypothetical protein B0A68_01715 [Flavobacterium reichenbachii]
MNVTDYNYLMNKPDAITEKQTEALGSVLNEFPYFQSARALRLKGLYNQNSFKYNYALKVTAAHTADRSVLFDFITSESFTSIQEKYYDQKLKDLLQINVVDSEVILPAATARAAEVRIDPIEKSILDSIKEATTVTFERSVKTEEPKIETVIEQPSVENTPKIETVIFDEVLKTEETETETAADNPVLDAINKIEAVTFEESVKIEEPIIPEIDQSILDSIKKIESITFEEPSKIEENKIDPFIEESILDSIKKIESVTFEEPVKIESKIEPIIDQSVLDAVHTIESVTFEEPVEIEEPKIEEHILIETEKPAEEPILIPEARIDPIEESLITSIKEAETVVFDEAPEEVKQEESSESVKNAIEHLEIGKPLDFSANEKHSFQEWLQLARTEPIDRTNETSEEVKKNEADDEEERKKKAEIIDKFIETNPKISPIKPTGINPTVLIDINKEDNSYLMTETLARVYLEQKKYTKAIQAYEILILKYPEKISFFADRISDIRILQQNNNNN